jgi:hypothetical protein
MEFLDEFFVVNDINIHQLNIGPFISYIFWMIFLLKMCLYFKEKTTTT